MDLEQWRRSGKYFEHLDRKIFWHADGQSDRESVLCIHGFPTASWDWHRLWPDLSRRFHLLALDMLGYGFSEKPTDVRYSTFHQADLHEKLLRERNVHRVHILAHDYGDTVAQELLARYEERRSSGDSGVEIESVCFLNGGLFPETHRIRLVQELLKSPLGFLVGRLMSEHRFGRSLSAVFGKKTRPTSAELHDFWKLVQFNGGANISHKLIRYVGERKRNRERWVGVLQKTTVPLRLIDGGLDPVSGAHMARRYREVVPRPDVVMLDDVGHYPQLESPEAVLLAYLEFVQRQAHGRATRAAASGVSGPQQGDLTGPTQPPPREELHSRAVASGLPIETPGEDRAVAESSARDEAAAIDEASRPVAELAGSQMAEVPSAVPRQGAWNGGSRNGVPLTPDAADGALVSTPAGSDTVSEAAAETEGEAAEVTEGEATEGQPTHAATGTPPSFQGWPTEPPDHATEHEAWPAPTTLGKTVPADGWHDDIPPTSEDADPTADPSP